MPFVRPSLVVDSTNTSGVGTYTLLGADPGDGFRTLADAVGDGDAANADTISYFVVDTTTKGATLQWEHGTGTIGGGGATLARTSIIESSNGDAAVSWGAGGTRTVRFGAGTAGFALLAAAQTFTGLNIFSALLTVSAGVRIENANAAGLELYSGGVRRGVVDMGANILRLLRYATDGTTVDTQLQIAGGLVNVATGTLQQGGTAVALQGVLNAPAGTRLLLGNNSVPTGWSIVAALADKTILTTSTASEIDDTGGNWVVSGLTATTTVDNATVTVNNATLAVYMSCTTGGGQTPVQQATHSHTTVAHNHTASTGVNSDGAWRPSYYKAGWIAKS